MAGAPALPANMANAALPSFFPPPVPVANGNIPLLSKLSLSAGVDTLVLQSAMLPANDYLVAANLTVLNGATAGNVSLSIVSYYSDGAGGIGTPYVSWGGAETAVGASSWGSCSANLVVHLWKNSPAWVAIGLVAHPSVAMTAETLANLGYGITPTFLTYFRLS